MSSPVASIDRLTGSRARALEAGLECFVGQGIAGASIERLCETAHLSVGSLYHHFGSKEGLAEALYVECLSEFQRAFLEELRRHADAERGIRGGVRVHLEWCLRGAPDRARFLLFFGDAARRSTSTALRDANRTFLGEVVTWWQIHAGYGELLELEPDLIHALWLGPADGFCRAYLSGRTRLSITRATAVLAEGAWQALQAQGDPK